MTEKQKKRIEKNVTYSRRDDMSNNRTLNVFIEDDGDICVFIGTSVNGAMRSRGDNDEIAYASVEFVAPAGGMRSPNVRKALIDLILAIQADNEENKI